MFAERCTLSNRSFITVRMWASTHKTLGLVAALTGERQTELMDRLFTAEAKRLGYSVVEEASPEALVRLVPQPSLADGR